MTDNYFAGRVRGALAHGPRARGAGAPAPRLRQRERTQKKEVSTPGSPEPGRAVPSDIPNKKYRIIDVFTYTYRLTKD